MIPKCVMEEQIRELNIATNRMPLGKRVQLEVSAGLFKASTIMEYISAKAVVSWMRCVVETL